MKTTVKLSAIVLMVLTLSTTAQIKVKPNNEPKPGIYNSQGQAVNHGNNGANYQNSPNQNANWQGGANVNLSFGNYPQNGWANGGPVYAYNGNSYYGYSIKKSAKYALYDSKALINRSIDIHNWNDIYSPLLAKAIRHHNYAKQMYRWGNFSAAINHAERAKYLAWYSLKYFQNPNCYNDDFGGNYSQDPYGDPYNPYYKSGDPNAKTNPAATNGNKKPAALESSEMDSKLPADNANDKELIRSFDQSKDE